MVSFVLPVPTIGGGGKKKKAHPTMERGFSVDRADSHEPDKGPWLAPHRTGTLRLRTCERRHVQTNTFTCQTTSASMEENGADRC